jgi:hypothetical protein
MTCTIVMEHDKCDTCYLQVPHIPTWSDLIRSHAGLARSTMIQLAPVWSMWALTNLVEQPLSIVIATLDTDSSS